MEIPIHELPPSSRPPANAVVAVQHANTKSSKSGIIIVVILLVIALGLTALVAYLLSRQPATTADTALVQLPAPSTAPVNSIATTPQPTPTPIDTADVTDNWKTYNNEEIGISFKHPADWEVKVLAADVDIQIGEIMHVMSGQAKQTQLDIYDSGSGPVTIDPPEFDSIVIRGIARNFKLYNFGEGHGGSSPECVEGGNLKTYYTEIREILVAISSTTSLSCDSDGKQLTTQTREEDVQIARMIAGTIAFTN